MGLIYTKGLDMKASNSNLDICEIGFRSQEILESMDLTRDRVSKMESNRLDSTRKQSAFLNFKLENFLKIQL